MTRILHVTAMGERGGLEVVLLNLLKRLDRRHFTPHVAFLADGPFVAEVEQEGIEAHVIPSGRVRDLTAGTRCIKAIAQIVRKRGISVVHTWNHKAHLYGGVAAAWAKVKSVYHLEVVPSPGLSRDGLVALASLLVPADATVACSQFVARQFRKLWHLRRRLEVIYNGTDVASPNGAQAAPLRLRLGLPTGSQVVVMASRLQKGKGVHVLVEAAADVLRRRSNLHFIIVGGSLFGLEKEYALQLERRVEALGIGQAVKFVGFQKDVLPFFAGADLVVHCSIDPEAFGMVLVEAMTCEKAVIATESGGPGEVVQDGVTGLLVPPADAGRLAEAILTLLADDERRRRMGAAGAARVQAHFTAERMARQVERVYRAVISSSFPGSSP